VLCKESGWKGGREEEDKEEKRKKEKEKDGINERPNFNKMKK
jgi:hypothetical protein